MVTESGLFFLVGAEGTAMYRVQLTVPVTLNTRVALGADKELAVVANTLTLAAVQCFVRIRG